MQRHEDMTAGATRSPLSERQKDRLSHFKLKRKVLHPASLCTLHGKPFVPPIKVAQAQPRDFTTAERIDRTQRQYGPRAKRRRLRPTRGVEQSPDFLPRWSFE